MALSRFHTAVNIVHTYHSRQYIMYSDVKPAASLGFLKKYKVNETKALYNNDPLPLFHCHVFALSFSDCMVQASVENLSMCCKILKP